MSGESSSADFERAKLVRQRGGKGRWVFLPDLTIREAIAGRKPEESSKDLWADRIVLDPGTRQILLRLHSEP